MYIPATATSVCLRRNIIHTHTHTHTPAAANSVCPRACAAKASEDDVSWKYLY